MYKLPEAQFMYACNVCIFSDESFYTYYIVIGISLYIYYNSWSILKVNHFTIISYLYLYCYNNCRYFMAMDIFTFIVTLLFYYHYIFTKEKEEEREKESKKIYESGI